LALILTSFGVALITTIIGISFRTILQSASDPYPKMHIQITNTTKKLTKANDELERTTGAFSKMTTYMESELADMSEKYVLQFREMSDAIMDITEKVNILASNFPPLNISTQSLKQSMENADEALAQFKGSINENVGAEIRDSVSEYIKDKISEKLQPLNDAISRLSASLLSLSSATQGASEDMSEHIREQVSEAISSLDGSVKNLSIEFRSLSESTEKMTNIVNNAQAYSDSYLNYSETIKKKHDKNMEQLDQLSSSIGRQIEIVNTLASTVHEGFVSIIRRLREESNAQDH